MSERVACYFRSRWYRHCGTEEWCFKHFFLNDSQKDLDALGDFFICRSAVLLLLENFYRSAGLRESLQELTDQHKMIPAGRRFQHFNSWCLSCE